MHKYQIDERVVVLHDRADGADVEAGEYGTVTALNVASNGVLFYDVKMDKPNPRMRGLKTPPKWCFNEDNLDREKVAQEEVDEAIRSILNVSEKENT